jgi:hypothetical protein
MDPISGTARQNRSIMRWASSENSGFYSTSFCVEASEVRPVVRSSPVTVSFQDGRAICSLCQTLDDSITFDEDGNMKKSGRTEYRDYTELDELAKKGCSPCKIFRAAILYHHPSNDAPELLARDDDSLSVYLNGQGTAISINYPFKSCLEDFEYDPEWPMGRPSFMLPGDEGPRKKYKRFNTATVDVPLAPLGFQLPRVAPSKYAPRHLPSIQNSQAWSSDDSSIIGKRSCLSMRLDLQGSGAVDDENLTMAASDEYSILIKAGDNSIVQERREEICKAVRDLYESGISYQVAG